uniref:Nuclear receptor domain-containing protein n=1 Tax=Meloidogyne incognita TaxID=6306 RepID=A0A914NUN4_MELIC
MEDNNCSAQSEHQQGPTTSSIKPLKKCMVCDTACSYHYYGVQSCEGCKQFFRRSVVKQKIFHCWKDKQCDITKANRCRGCRLDRCLLVGMDPLLINAESTQSLDLFIKELENRRIKLLNMHNDCHATPSSDDISLKPNLHNNCTNVAIQSNLTSGGASDSRLMNTRDFQDRKFSKTRDQDSRPRLDPKTKTQDQDLTPRLKTKN